MAISLRPRPRWRPYRYEPAVAQIRCPACGDQWEAFGTVEQWNGFEASAAADMRCPTCGTLGEVAQVDTIQRDPYIDEEW